MRTSFTILLLPAIIAAHMAWSPNLKPMLDLQSIPETQQPSTPSQQISTPTPTPTPSRPTSTPATATHAWDPLISSASHLLDELNDHLHLDLRKRQGGVGATNAIAVVTQPVQMPSVTVYSMRTGGVWTYTQVFSTPLVPFPAPVAGQVGMGTIQGAIGVVKSITKRDVQTATLGQVVTIKGREVTMV